jgi:SAM-dependent methyltransferase
VVDGIPILINESNSFFAISDFTQHRSTFISPRSKLEHFMKRILPSIDQNLKAEENFSKFVDFLLKQDSKPKVLVLGGCIIGRGLKNILSNPSIQFTETDVLFGPRTALICDAHDIPFDDGVFDGVIIQAVLEHVVDPYRCIEEIHRVLKENGIVYAETAFMQQLHGTKYDFTRFTHLGHRRLFKKFEEICSGAEGGPGMALAWAYKAFLLSFTRSRSVRAIINVFVRLTAWWLKYIDYYLIDKPASFDAALEYYFMGRKSSKIISDKKIVEDYKGVFV